MDVNIVDNHFFQTQFIFLRIVHFLFEIFHKLCSIDMQIGRKQNTNIILQGYQHVY